MKVSVWAGSLCESRPVVTSTKPGPGCSFHLATPEPSRLNALQMYADYYVKTILC